MDEPSKYAELCRQLLEERDAESRRAAAAERKLAELADQAGIRAEYEGRLAEKDRCIADKDKALEKKDRRIQKLEEKIQKLEQQMAYDQRQLWGQRSEKHPLPENPLQLKLDFGEAGMEPGERQAMEEAIADAKKAQEERRKPKPSGKNGGNAKRKPLPAHLERRDTVIWPDGYKGHEEEWDLFPLEESEVTEVLHFRKADLWVERIIRRKARRKDTREIKTGALPRRPIPNSFVSTVVLVYFMVGKYANHMPFHRQIEIFRRQGMPFAQSTVEGWFKECANLMRPTYFRLRELVLDSGYVMADETTVPIISNEKHKTVKGYLWEVADVLGGLAFFHYDQGSRAAKVAEEIFAGYEGVIQTDGYAGYNTVAKMNGIALACCWCHLRRAFERALASDKECAEEALTMIGYVYALEKSADEAGLSHKERALMRQQKTYYIIRGFELWCLRERNKVLPKSPIGEAISYFLERTRELSLFVTDGRIHPDTNLAERSIRPVAVGRKGYLFCGNHDAAEDAAVIYSMMACCKSADVGYEDWMEYFLDHVHDYDDDYSKDLAELLPHSLKAKGILKSPCELEKKAS